MTSVTVARPTSSRSQPDRLRPGKKSKDARPDIWSSLLRQTREAQARSRTDALHLRELLICGGSASDQRDFVNSIARPPPFSPSRHTDVRDAKNMRLKGQPVLSNAFAYGYGHLTLFSPPRQMSHGLSGESDEVARLELHTAQEPDVGFESIMRRQLSRAGEDDRADVDAETEGRDSSKQQRPSVVLLLSWKTPWTFLSTLRQWLQLLSRALLPEGSPPEDPEEVLLEHKVGITIVVQHVEAQEFLEREGYNEELFDYIGQSLRTCVQHLKAGVVYTQSAPVPSSSGLSELQKIIYTALDLDLGVLSSPQGSAKGELAPRHNVVDRMSLVIPAGWDSLGKIRMLSETFSPEDTLAAWKIDLATPVKGLARRSDATKSDTSATTADTANASEPATFETRSANAGALQTVSSDIATDGAIVSFEQQVRDPLAHKKTQTSPQIEKEAESQQKFLATMRDQLVKLEKQDSEKARKLGNNATPTGPARGGLAQYTSTQSGALDNLGDVSFNVGGVNYNAAGVEAAIERMRRPQPGTPSSASDSPRNTTPRPPRRGLGRSDSIDPASSTPRSDKADTMTNDELENYFHSLMKRGKGGSSAQSTPSKPPTDGR